MLAFNDKGREVISGAKDTAEIPIITKVSGETSSVFNMECAATDLYTLFSKEVSPCGLEFKNSPIYVKKDR
ncbi:MAG: nucleotidyltransferase family protein [Clostridia bacterium]|nr:nucleotidyltransferase family protein [Clostridia bacterium]